MAGRLSRDDDELVETHDINITPFIDVMLVLLIIFMVAAPLSTVDVPVELPVAVSKPQPRPEKPVYLTVKADLSIAIGEQPVSEEDLVQGLDMATRIRLDTRIYVRADKSVPYGALMNVLNKLRLGGYLKVGLVGLEGTDAAPPTAPPQNAPPATP